MAIVNRDLDPSQQKDVVMYRSGLAPTNGATFVVAGLPTGATANICVIPYPCVLQSISAVAFGVSNAMQCSFGIQRFAAGATVIQIGISGLVLVNFGTSGVLNYSGLAAAGSTLLALQQGDILNFSTSVSNGNALDLLMEIVLKKSQDIVQHNLNNG